MGPYCSFISMAKTKNKKLGSTLVYGTVSTSFLLTCILLAYHLFISGHKAHILHDPFIDPVIHLIPEQTTLSISSKL